MAQAKPSAPGTMEALRTRYVQRLAARRGELHAFAAAFTAGRDIDDEELRYLAHNLAGSGATYGFPEISTLAGDLEDLLALPETGANRETKADLIWRLVEACDNVLAEHAPPAEERETAPAMTSAHPSLDDLAWAEEDLTGAGTLTAPMQEPAPAPTSAAASPPSQRNRPVLLTVDDDLDIREAVEMLFEDIALVYSAADAKHALELIQEKHPDVVLLDERIPGMSGVELLEKLGTMPELANIAVVMLTANHESSSVMRAIAAGAVDYLVKPFEPETLKERVGAMLENASLSILIADDDPLIRDLLSGKFRAAGMDAETARNGMEVLELTAQRSFSLIILDRMMPGMDGLAVLKKLKSTAADHAPPVLFLTARRNEQDVIEGLREGALDYVVKPFVPDEVVARALRIIEREREKRHA